MRILAIDPGFERVGIAIIEAERGEKEKLLYSECFKTSRKDLFPIRLFSIGKEVRRIIKQYKPNVLAVETLLFNTNQKTVMGVSEARGVIVYEASSCGLRVSEYTPLQVKIAVTGYGRATKEQVMIMIPRLINLPKSKKRLDDEYDAIAIGITHAVSRRSAYLF